MNLLPNQTISDLHHNAWGRLPLTAEQRVERLDVVSESADAKLIRFVIDFTADTDPVVADAASRAVVSLFSRLDLRDYPQFEQALRAESRYQPPASSWYGMPVLTLARWIDKPGALTMLGLASFHPNGYIREAAVQKLDALFHADAVPFLLLRLGDWVHPVRSSAASAIERRLSVDQAALWVRWLPLVLQLAANRPDSHSGLQDQVINLLSSPAALETVPALLAQPDRPSRRVGFRLLMEHDAAHAAQWTEEALLDSDTAVRSMAMEKASATLPPNRLLALLPRLACDGWVRARRFALDVRVRMWPETAITPLRLALLDTSSAIRAEARLRLASFGVTDLINEYISALTADSPSTAYSAIRGVGEIGEPKHAELLRPFLSNSVPRIRRATVESLVKLLGYDALPTVFPMIADESTSVSRSVFDVLQPKAPRLDSEALWYTLVETRQRHVRLNVLRLISATGRWRSIPLLVRAASLPDAETADLANHEISLWVTGFTRGYVRPSATELAVLSTAIEVSERPWNQLSDIIRFWRE